MSALMGIVLHEPSASSCGLAAATADRVAISAATATEAPIVADQEDLGGSMRWVLGNPGLQIADVTPAFADRIAEAYSGWRQGFHPARLNLGERVAYALAKERGCPLLLVEQDFTRTNIESAL